MKVLSKVEIFEKKLFQYGQVKTGDFCKRFNELERMISV